QGGTAGLENGLAIRHRLPGLIVDRVSGQAAGVRVDADDARDEHVRSGLDSLAVERRTRRVRSRDDLPWHVAPRRDTAATYSNPCALWPSRPCPGRGPAAGICVYRWLT